MTFAQWIVDYWIWIVAVIAVIIFIVALIIVYKKMPGKIKVKKGKWNPYGYPILSGGRIFLVEYSPKEEAYRYIRVPSFREYEDLTKEQ